MIRFFIGLPGSGKTTLACKMLNQRLKKKHSPYKNFYSNFTTKFSRVVKRSTKNLGVSWTYKQYSYVSIDEAGIDYNNRKFKELPQATIEWYKKHRHRHIDIDIFSQESDIDVTLKRLVSELYTLKRIGPWTLVRRWNRTMVPDEDGGWPKVVWRPSSFLSLFTTFFSWITFGILPFSRNYSLMFRPFYYKHFDSYEIDKHLPEV